MGTPPPPTLARKAELSLPLEIAADSADSTLGVETPRPSRRRRRSRRVTQSVVDRLLDSSQPALAGEDLALPRFQISDIPPDLAMVADAEPAEPSGTPAPERHPVVLDESRIDPDAAKVVWRLVRARHEAYLVGGCVRDLLLGFQPKDFDVATSAAPDEVRRLFRNSRIIGRRFRLVHVLFGSNKVIETATFRRAPQHEEDRAGGDLLIRSDNEFGAAHEDARRRDFTVNGLFYDLEAQQVLDWVGGMPDIARRTINTIGDPVVRFREDPVRMLRAIKFSARLDCGIAPEVYDALVCCREALVMAARPRLFEELLRLLRGGAAHRSFWLAWETGLLDVLLPELATYLADEGEAGGLLWPMLTQIDRYRRENGDAPDDVVLWTVLLIEPLLEACSHSRDRLVACTRFLEPIIDRLNVPRRIADAMRRILGMWPRLEAGRPGRFQRSAIYATAEAVLEMRRRAQAAMNGAPIEAPAELPASNAEPRRRSRRQRGSRPPKR